MTQLHPLGSKPVPPATPFECPLPEAAADTRKLLSAGKGELVIVDELQACVDHEQDLRRARVSGMILGGTLSLAAYTTGIILRAVMQNYWPVVCDGTGSVIICGLRLVGVAA